jgi:signal transduction histidine kinase
MWAEGKDGRVHPWQSLRGKLVVSHLAVIFVATLISGFTLLSLARRYFLDAMERSLFSQAELIRQTVLPNSISLLPPSGLPPAYNALQQQQVDGISVQIEGNRPATDPDVLSQISSSNLAALGDISLQIAAALQTEVRILDTRGIVLVASSQGEVGADLSQTSLVSAGLSGNRQATVENMGQDQVLRVALPLASEGGVAGVVILSQPLGDMLAVLSDLRARLIYASFLATALSGAAALLLARNIAGPVTALTAAADKLRAGNFDHPLPSQGKDELAHLTQSFAAMRDQIWTVQKMRTQFVSDVSHELRTPLTAIKGLAETLQQGAADDPSARDRFLASIGTETDRLIRLVNDLLILSRADSHAMRMHPQRVRLESLLLSTVRLFSAQLDEKGLELSVRQPPDPISLNLDPDRMAQVLSNLLDNALKHTPAGGEIRVTVGDVQVRQGALRPATEAGRAFADPRELPRRRPLPEGRWLLITIRDTGWGISPSDQPHLFERFYRADKSRARDRGGSGLGLPIAKALVEAHGGHIWLESPVARPSAAEATGTTAALALPVHS